MIGDYYKTEESVKEYIKLAKDVNGTNLIEKLKKFLPIDSTLLEIGSGPGTDFDILKKSFQTVGSDNSEEFLKHLNDQYPKDEFIQLEASTLQTDKEFDGIYSNKVMHHLKDDELVLSIKRQYEILTLNGIICHSFWKGEGSEIFKGLFVNYYNENRLRTAFETYFDILYLESYAEFDQSDSLLLIAKKK